MTLELDDRSFAYEPALRLASTLMRTTDEGLSRDERLAAVLGEWRRVERAAKLGAPETASVGSEPSRSSSSGVRSWRDRWAEAVGAVRSGSAPARPEPSGSAHIRMLSRHDRLLGRHRSSEVSQRVVLIPRLPHTEHLVSIGPNLHETMLRCVGRWSTNRWFGRLIDTRLGGWAVWIAAPDAALIVHPASERVGLSCIYVSYRSRAHGTVSVGIAGGDGAMASVVKAGIDRGGRRRVAAEAWALETIGPILRQCGAEVPEILEVHPDAVVQSMVTGRSARRVVSDRPDTLTPMLSSLLTLLSAWHRTSRDEVSHAANCDRAAEEVRLVTAAHPQLGALAAVALAKIDDLRSLSIASVATHGDLTTANVVVNERGLGVIDWEAARSDGFPLQDAWYFAADALGAAMGCSRADAVCLLRRPMGRAVHVVQAIERMADGLGVPADAAATLADLTWWMHASDEVRRCASARPFVDVLHVLAASH